MRWAVLAAVAAIGLTGAAPQQTERSALGSSAAVPEGDRPSGAGRTPEAKGTVAPIPPASPIEVQVEAEQPDWTEQAQAISAILVALFTLVLTYVGWQQWRLLKRSTEESAQALAIAKQSADAATAGAEATQKLAENAKESASAAKKSLALAKRHGEMGLRAYLCVKDAKIYDVETGKSPRALVQLENCGQTPATNVRIYGVISVSTYDADMWSLLDLQGKASKQLIGPGAQINSRPALGAPLEGQLDALIRSQVAFLQVAGEVRYEDVFGAERVTRYRFYALPDPEGGYLLKGHEDGGVST